MTKRHKQLLAQVRKAQEAIAAWPWEWRRDLNMPELKGNKK